MFKKIQHFVGSSPLFIVGFKELLETIGDKRKFHTVIINRVLYSDGTYSTARKEQQTYRVHEECYRAEGLPLVAVQKMVLAPYCFLPAVEDGIKYMYSLSAFLFN